MNTETPIVVTCPSSTKQLEHYENFYVVEQRGWRVKISHTGSEANDLRARQLVDEMDIQHLLYLSGGTAEIDIRNVHRVKPFKYEIDWA